MKIFEQMKAALEAQAPLVEQPEQASELPFSIGDRIAYRVPVIDQTPRQYTWVEYHGFVSMVDAQWEMVTVIPEDEDHPWRWVAWCYVKKADTP